MLVTIKMECKICHDSIVDLKYFKRHMSSEHKHTTIFDCPHNLCYRKFLTSKILYQHFLTHNEIELESDRQVLANDCAIEVLKIQQQNININPKKTDVDKMFEMMHISNLKLILSLLADESLPRSKSLNITNQIQSNLKGVLDSLKILHPTLDFQHMYTPLNLNSEHKVKQHLKELGLYIESHSKIIASFNKERFVGGLAKIIKDERVLRIVDIKTVLEKLFNLPQFLNELLNHIDKLMNRPSYEISNIIQTNFWHNQIKHNLDSSVIYLPIHVYFDDFEPLNVLGSHSGAYKIGATYMNIPCLPECAVSKLKHMFLLMLFFSDDRSHLGNKTIFSPIIQILNSLFDNGISVNHSKIRTIKFITCHVLGDNLGLNSLFGFTENFVAHFYCRICRLNRDEMRLQPSENCDALRNIQNYKSDVATCNVSLTGIKEESVWNNLRNFHVTKNLSVDIMHDLLEGVCHYDLCQIILNFINVHKYFSLAELNSFIETFNYGPLNRNRKIDSITIEMLNKNKIKASASEMSILFKYFANIIGHKIPKQNIEWIIYLSLKQIMGIVMSKTIHIKQHELLKELIYKHHVLYIECFGPLKPKHHFMIHYPEISKSIGPISSLSAMRFESFHKNFKSVSKTISCRINMLTSLTTKYEYQVANLLLNFKSFHAELSSGPALKINRHNFLQKYKFDLSGFENFKITNWVKIDGLLIKNNVVIQVGVEKDETFHFGIVKNILHINNEIYLCLQDIETIGFDEHYDSFKIKLETKHFVCHIKALNLDKLSYVIDGIDGQFISF